MEKIINYFFDEEEKELIQAYGYLLKLAIVMAFIIVLVVIT